MKTFMKISTAIVSLLLVISTGLLSIIIDQHAATTLLFFIGTIGFYFGTLTSLDRSHWYRQNFIRLQRNHLICSTIIYTCIFFLIPSLLQPVKNTTEVTFLTIITLVGVLLIWKWSVFKLKNLPARWLYNLFINNIPKTYWLIKTLKETNKSRQIADSLGVKVYITYRIDDRILIKWEHGNQSISINIWWDKNAGYAMDHDLNCGGIRVRQAEFLSRFIDNKQEEITQKLMAEEIKAMMEKAKSEASYK